VADFEVPMKILVAERVITMDPLQPFGEAVAVRGDSIVAVDSLAACRSRFPNTEIVATGARALLPGFVAPDASPVLSSSAAMPPRYYIAPWVAPTWAEAVGIFTHAMSVALADSPLLFHGFDPTLHGRALPSASELDTIFGSRMVAVIGRSGLSTSVTTRVLDVLGWLDSPPADPADGRYGRDPSGRLDGTAYGATAASALSGAVLAATHTDSVHSTAQYFALMSEVGFTTSAELGYHAGLRSTYETLAGVRHNPLRMVLYHAAFEDDAFLALDSLTDARRLHKQGVRLRIDDAEWSAGRIGFRPSDVESILAAAAAVGTQVVITVENSDSFDVALDACERALSKATQIAFDHRWRIEHRAGASLRQIGRATRLGVLSSMSPLEFYYAGDDGETHPREAGYAHRFRDVHGLGGHPYFRSGDASVPISPLLATQTAVSRLTHDGVVRGLEQSVTLTQALEALTLNAAHAIGLDHLIGSITPGKFADFVELSADPFTVPVSKLAREVTVQGTWVAGEKVDLARFRAATSPDASGPCITQPIPVHYLPPRAPAHAIA
jgi:predicted amidohydrolase YtcJ